MIGPYTILENADVTYLDEVLLDGQFLRLLPAAEFAKIKPEHLQIWAVRNCRYGLVTKELVDWLREMIGGRFTVELGAGKGDLGRHLGIVQTDSYMQTRPEIQAYYQMLGQPIIEPPDDVYQYDALDAVKGLKPEVAVASWLTQLITAEECTPDTQGSVYGADEMEIISRVKMYIHIGNLGSHASKKALQLPHREFQFPWLWSRSNDQSTNIIYVWGE